jgi:hypothetical protein
VAVLISAEPAFSLPTPSDRLSPLSHSPQSSHPLPQASTFTSAFRRRNQTLEIQATKSHERRNSCLFLPFASCHEDPRKQATGTCCLHSSNQLSRFPIVGTTQHHTTIDFISPIKKETQAIHFCGGQAQTTERASGKVTRHLQKIVYETIRFVRSILVQSFT